MRLSKLDLSNLVAVGHADGYLGLLIDRGDEMEYIEIPAPVTAYQGLQQVSSLAAPENASISAAQPLAMLPVNSSMAKAIGYNNESQTLQVEFHSGAVYQYSDVDSETWESLQAADSTGRFFNSEIKGNYDCDRVDVTPTKIVTLDCSTSYILEEDE